MPEKINLMEPETCNYLFIDESNRVHLLLPITGGRQIGLDTTCETTRELRDFFFGSNQTTSCEDNLRIYEKNLEDDIEAINSQKGISRYAYQDLIKGKKQRLEQIKKYISLLEELKENYIEGDIDQLQVYFPNLPSAILKIIKSAQNAFAIRLSPDYPDSFTRFDTPVFSLLRNRSIHEPGGFKRLTEGLGARLYSTFLHTPIDVNSNTAKNRFTQTIIDTVNIKKMDEGNLEDNLKNLKELIKVKLEKIIPDLSEMKSHDNKELNIEYLKNIMGLTETDSINEWIIAIIEACTDPSIWEQDDTLNVNHINLNPEELADKKSIRVQFFLAEINIYCKINKLSDVNFGTFFDIEPHATNIGELVKESLSKGSEIEPLIYNYINNHQDALGLNAPLTYSQQKEINEKFTNHYNIIKDSPHFDEFFIIDPAKSGTIFSHQSRICCHFLDFFTLHTKGKYPLDSFEHYSEALQGRPASLLEHKNELVNQGKRINKFREEIIRLLAENNPKELLDYLLKKSPTGNPNYSLLSLETQNYISYSRYWPSIETELLNQKDILPSEKADLLKLLSQSNVNEENLSAITWSKHSSIPLLEIELDKVANGLIRTVEIYNEKRSRQWFKGFRNDARSKQCEDLIQVGHEFLSLLDSKPISNAQVLEKLLQSIETLDRINKEISLEPNKFQSSLQKEINVFKKKLKELCELGEYDFKSTNPGQFISAEIEKQLDKINAPAVKEIVQQLPAHCYTDEAIDFFNTLDLDEITKIANYLNIEYRELNNSIEKNTLLNQDIPQLFKIINLQLLSQLKQDEIISNEAYLKLSNLADKIPPQLMTKEDILSWAAHPEQIEESNLSNLLSGINITKVYKRVIQNIPKEPEEVVDKTIKIQP